MRQDTINQAEVAEERHLFAVDGMWCGGCARGLETRLRSIDGVVDAGVHFVTSSALVRWDARRCDLERIARSVRTAGYQIHTHIDPRETSERMSKEIGRLSIRLAVALFFGMWSMAATFALYMDADFPTLTAWWLAAASGILAVPVIFYSGANFLRMGLRSVALRTPGIDLLVSLGVAGSTLLSVSSLARGASEIYFDTAVMLVTLLLIGRLVETSVRRGAVDALTAMDGLADETAKFAMEDGSWQDIPCAKLVLGDRVVIEAGAASSVDGMVVAGSSLVDRSIISGESTAVHATRGFRISAGTVNLTRRLVVRIDRLHGDRDIDRMGGRIAIEIASRGELQSLTDYVASRLVQGVPVLAIAIGVWTGFQSTSAEIGFIRGLTVLVIACPCALSIATPLAYVRAASLAARSGFRVRDPLAFERLATMRTAIFDKTGTLTVGRPTVVAVEPTAGWTELEVLKAAALAETAIAHPLARAIVERHGGPVGDGGERLPRGAAAVDVQGRAVFVTGSTMGSARDCRSRLDVLIDGQKIGNIALADEVCPNAAETIVALKLQGIEVMIATGDAEGPALSIAIQLGVAPEMVKFSCTPRAKATIVRNAVGPVLFVGDGVNDGPALAAADCGLSVMGSHAAAASTASIIVVQGGIEVVVKAILLARKTTRIIRQNLGVALIYNVIAIPAAAAGLLSPAAAVTVMFASSLNVVANTLRLRVICDPDIDPTAPSNDLAMGSRLRSNNV